jgi:TolA-binding protein
MYNLGRLDEAQPLFEQIANRNQSVLGARSQFMIGEVHFGEKRYDAAVRMFFRVFDGYGGEQALPEFHHWQAEAMFEAARCLEQTGRTKSAHKLYRELVERFPNSEKVPHAQNKLR